MLPSLTRGVPLLLSFALAFTACQADDTALVLELPSPAPACVQDFINTTYAIDKSALWYVRAQYVGSEVHYLLDTGAPSYDGVDFIVNSACDTVCTLGGRRIPPPCEADYDREKWMVVWKG